MVTTSFTMSGTNKTPPLLFASSNYNNWEKSVTIWSTFTSPYEIVSLEIAVLRRYYCLTKISIRAKRSISRVFSLSIVPSPFFVHCPYKSRINRAESVLTGLKPY